MTAKSGLLLILITPTLAGCFGSIDSHENFKNIISYDVGKPFDTTITNRNGYLGKRKLDNGNHEHQYLVSTPDCHVFMEVNPNTNIVVDWRFVAPNPQTDCYINP